MPSLLSTRAGVERMDLRSTLGAGRSVMAHPSRRRPCERRDPYPPGFIVTKVVRDRGSNDRFRGMGPRFREDDSGKYCGAMEISHGTPLSTRWRGRQRQVWRSYG